MARLTLIKGLVENSTLERLGMACTGGGQGFGTDEAPVPVKPTNPHSLLNRRNGASSSFR